MTNFILNKVIYEWMNKWKIILSTQQQQQQAQTDAAVLHRKSGNS